MNYKKVYDLLIEKVKKENRKKQIGIYYEAHHIIPKCLGGQGSYSRTKQHPNIVLLTAKEHFIAHLLLHKMYPENKPLMYACWRMCNIQNKYREYYRPSSRIYEEIKTSIASFNRTLKVSDEVRKKISDTMSGRPAHNKGKKVPKEILYKWQGPQNKVECPKCGKVGGSHAMKRFHFDNCGIAKIPLKQVECPYCNLKGRGGVMKRFHFDNCKKNKQ